MGLGTIFTNIKTFFSNLGEKIKNLFSGFDGLSSVQENIKAHSKIVIIAAGALLVIVVLLLVLAMVSHSASHPRSAADLGYSVDTSDILPRKTLPADDFYLPYEPNFVPDVLLEREPKDGWTEEDARPFWTDPLKGNEEFWRKRIESGINSLLERVP